MKTGLTCLFVALTAGSALAAGGKSPAAKFLPLKLELPAVPVVFSAPTYPGIAVEPRVGAPGGLGGGARYRGTYWGCGGLGVVMEFPVRPSKLADPLAVLGAAYLQCRAIQADELAPVVPVALYPEGYFGEWVRDGVMVKTRVEFSDEGRMRRLFSLLAESVDVPEDEDDRWILETGADLTADDYRREADFASEWAIEFVGVESLRLGFDLSARRLLVEAGDHWDSYVLSPGRAAALRELLRPAAPVMDL